MNKIIKPDDIVGEQVWVVARPWSQIKGVFSSKEAAQKYINDRINYHSEYQLPLDIHECRIQDRSI